MKNIYLFGLAICSFACNSSQDRVYESTDTTAVTVETPAIDTTVVDTFGTGAQYEGTELANYQSEAYKQLQTAMSGMTFSEKEAFLRAYEQQLNEYERLGDDLKYNSRSGISGSYDYNYDISGEDENGNSVSGNVDIQGKEGGGTITDADGIEKSIDVEWVDYGVLEGTDEDGVSYELHVDD